MRSTNIWIGSKQSAQQRSPPRLIDPAKPTSEKRGWMYSARPEADVTSATPGMRDTNRFIGRHPKFLSPEMKPRVRKAERLTSQPAKLRFGVSRAVIADINIAMDPLYHNTDLVEAYDAINSSREDLDFYLGALPDAPAAILDIGCGTGTFALDMARRGYSVTAVDPAPQMIAAAKRKDLSGSVNWVTGLISDVAADFRCDIAVMTGHAFQCLLKDEDIITVLEAVKTRLNHDGSFWFETRNPAAQAWCRWTPEHTAPPTKLCNGRSVRVVRQLLDVARGAVTFREQYVFSNPQETLVSQSTLRFPELEEIKDMAVGSGFTVRDVFGNWSKEPLLADSPEIIVRLTKEA